MAEIDGNWRNTIVLVANSKSQLTVMEIQVATITPPTDLASIELTLACIGNRVPAAMATSARKMFCGFLFPPGWGCPPPPPPPLFVGGGGRGGGLSVGPREASGRKYRPRPPH